MRTDVDRYHNVAFDVKDNAQIRFDFGRIDRTGITGGKSVDLVGTPARLKRILVENKKRLARATLLLAGTFSKLRQNARAARYFLENLPAAHWGRYPRPDIARISTQ